MFLEQGVKAGAVFGVESDDAIGDQLPRRRRPDADDLTGPEAEKVRKRVPARDAGDAGDKEGQTGYRMADEQRRRFHAKEEWPGRDSNPQALRHRLLRPACMPVPPPGRRDSERLNSVYGYV
jgi:hypothetical protein